jgi:hypothetical protein
MTIKIASSMIAKKAVAGKLSGEPVLYVLTKGGLHAFFSKEDGKLTTLATAPHRAIGIFFAEKKAKELDKKLEWSGEFLQKNEQDITDLIKSEEDGLFNSLRAKMFAPKQKKHVPSPNYYVYDIKSKNIGMMSGKDVALAVANKTLPKDSAIRREDLSDDVPSHHSIHPDFANLHRSITHHTNVKKWHNQAMPDFYNTHPSHAQHFDLHGIKEASDGSWGSKDE